MITIRVTRAHPPTWGSTDHGTPTKGPVPVEVASGTPVGVERPTAALPCTRAALRRLRVEHGSWADEGARPTLANGGDGVAHGLAVDVRRRGLRAGGRAVD